MDEMKWPVPNGDEISKIWDTEKKGKYLKFIDFQEMYLKMPKGYNPTDKVLIKTFGERLGTVRKEISKRNAQIQYVGDFQLKGPKYCTIKTQTDLANALGVSQAMISKYESGDMTEIPEDLFLKLYDIYGVTPHYLLGYTHEWDRHLVIDKNGEPKKNKAGEIIEAINPLEQNYSMQSMVEDMVQNIIWTAPNQFAVIVKLMTANEKIRNNGIEMIRLYLEAVDPENS